MPPQRNHAFSGISEQVRNKGICVALRHMSMHKALVARIYAISEHFDFSKIFENSEKNQIWIFVNIVFCFVDVALLCCVGLLLVGNLSGTCVRKRKKRNQKASSTLRSSRAVPHPSTNRALRRLTSEFGRDPVHSTRYGRWRRIMRSTKKTIMKLQMCLVYTQQICCTQD